MIDETRAAVERRMLGDIQTLLQDGADVNQQESQGATLVHTHTHRLGHITVMPPVFHTRLSPPSRFVISSVKLPYFSYFSYETPGPTGIKTGYIKFISNISCSVAISGSCKYCANT